MINEEYLTTPAIKLPKGERSFNEFIYTEVFKKNTVSLPDFLYYVSTLWKTEKFNAFLKYIQKVEVLNYNNSDFRFVSAFYRRALYTCICGKESLTPHCSFKCANSDPSVKAKKIQTVMKRFGVQNPAQSKEVQEKIQQTCLEKYGVPSSSQSDVIKKKTKLLNSEKYGVNHPMKTETVKEHQKSVIREHLGVDYPMQSKEVQEKAKKTCLEKYGVDNISKSEHFRTVVFENNFKKTYKNFNNYNKNFIVEHFVKENAFCIREFSGYFGIHDRCVINKLKVRLGILEPNNDTTFVPGKSKAEIDLFEWIPANRKISGSRQIIPPLEIDIYLPDYKLAIEYNGIYYHSDTFKSEGYHIFKTLECERQGIQLLHVFEFDDIKIWKSIISGKLGLNRRIPARKCEVREVSSSEASEFLGENHLQGSCSASVRLGLYFGGELVEIMTFGKPRFNRRFDFELLRLCSKKFTTVVGGASRLLKHFRGGHPGSIISYANRRFSKGDVYRKLGFSELGKTDVNYFYVRGDIVLSRYQCQKHRLASILGNFDAELTERGKHGT